MNKKYIKIAKREHAFKDQASTFNVETLNSFISKLLLKDTESAMKSKLINFLSELKDFKFMATLALVFTKIEKEDKTESQPARNVPRTSPCGRILVQTSRTIIGPK